MTTESESQREPHVHPTGGPMDFRALFDASPAPLLVLAPPEFRIVEVNAAYLSATMTERSDLLGRSLFEMFPDNPHEPQADGVRNLRTSLERVLATGRSDAMPVQRYPIRRPAAKGGGFEERWWLPLNAPVRGAGGEVALIIHHVEDVTEEVADRVCDAVEHARTESALRESEAKLRAVIEESPVAMALVGKSGEILFRNPRFDQLWGRPAHDTTARGYSEVYQGYHMDGRPIASEEWPAARAVLQGEVVQNEVYEIVQADGRRITCWFGAAPIRNASGEISGGGVLFRDVTKEHRIEAALRESEERYRTLFDQMVAGIAESDLKGRIITANDRYCEMLGYSREEVLSLKMQDVTHPDDLPDNVEQFERCRNEGVPFEIEKRYIRKDGSIVWVHNSVSLVRDAQGRPKSMVAAVLDITHRVRTEQALAEANRAKDEFLAMLGHELRNPLSPIVTTLQLMKLRAPDTLSVERGIIEQQVRYISDMVDDLLDVARIARGKVELKTAPVQIAEIAAAAIETTQPLFEEREQMLHSAILDGLVVSGDRRRLVQVVVNLLANAAKYSPRGRAIYFSAAAEGNEVVLRVRDEGVGIDPALLPRVFELFTQDEQSIERSRGGLGLGLAIVRNLIEMHGGSVSANSAGRDRGSEFVVRLPLLERRIEPETHRATASPARGGAPACPAKAPARVLIVDDYVLAAESLGALLQELGFETHIAHDGASALAAVAQFQPSIALVDIGLPVMDGYEVARRLRRTPGSERLPLVALTGYGQQSDRERVRQAGFDEHLVKPVDAERIGALIEKLVSARAH